MRKLRVEHGHDMTPGFIAAGLTRRARLPGQLTDQMGGNEIAELTKHRHLGPGWLVCFLLHTCRVAGKKHSGQLIFSLKPWDDCAHCSLFIVHLWGLKG